MWVEDELMGWIKEVKEVFVDVRKDNEDEN